MVAYYWLRRKLRAAHTIVLLWVFLKWGTRLFDYTRMHENKHGRTTAMFFAQDERQMNIAVRSYIVWLDEQGKHDT